MGPGRGVLTLGSAFFLEGGAYVDKDKFFRANHENGVVWEGC